MVRRCLPLGVVFAAAVLSGLPCRGASEEDPRVVAEFLQGLREKGYYDLAAEYIAAVRSQPDAPPSLKDSAEYELGRLVLDEASKTGDLVRRKELLEQARAKLDGFTRTNPKHPKAPEALVELARLLVERGHLAMLQADETDAAAEKASKLAEARASFDAARTAYASAAERLKADFARFPAYIADDKREERAEKDRVHSALMQAQLQKAVVDYEQGETYKPGSKERAALMSSGLAQFEDLYKRYRLNMAGLAARMWQAKCYEERGDLGPAMGIYNELMEHQDPHLRPLQRYVGWFRIIVLGKRQEYTLAALEAMRWLQANNSPDLLRSKEGLGVQLELARNILAQLPKVEDEGDRAAAIKKATDTLGMVVRVPSPSKAEALELLKKYKPKAAANAADVNKLTYDEAVSAGEQAMAAQEWDRGTLLMRQAVRRAESARDVDKTNYARYNLAFCHYKNQRYYEAVVLCDHLARRYPRGGLSPKAAEMAIVSLAEAYSAPGSIDRTADIDNLIDIARYTAETYPDLEQGDTARYTLGQIYHGTGRYDEAVKAFDSVRPQSSRSADARTGAGGSHWKKSLTLRDDGKGPEADAEMKKGVESLQGALAARQESGATPADPGLMNNACDLAEIYLGTDRPADALKLLDPIAKAQKAPYGPAFSRLMGDVLRAHVATNQVDAAVADMTTLEKAGGPGANLTQLYFGLGALLKKETEALAKKGDKVGLGRVQAAYLKFLNALVASKAGQTFDSLKWAGDNMLTLGHPAEARAVFETILKTYENDPKFLAQPGAPDRLMLTRLKLAASLRGQGDHDGAAALVESVAKDYPKSIEVLMEKGMLLEARATAKKSPSAWAAAFRQWQDIALRLGRVRVKPAEYYDAWYHAALALKQEGKAKEARQTLAGVMRLSPTLGGPEMKQKYKTLLDQMK